MKGKNTFEEVKVQMLMRLYGISHRAAVKKLHSNVPPCEDVVPEPAEGDGMHIECGRPGERVLTAKDFFGDDDDDFVDDEI